MVHYSLMEVWVLARIIFPVAPKERQQNEVNQSLISFNTELYNIDKHDCPLLTRTDNSTREDESVLAGVFREGSASSRDATKSCIGHPLIKYIKHSSSLTEHVAALNHLTLSDTQLSLWCLLSL